MTKNIVIGVLAVLTLFFGYIGIGRSGLGANATGPAHLQLESFWQGVQLGQRTKEITAATLASCNLIGTDVSLAASSTAAYDCAVTGITSSFNVVAMLASTTPRGGSSSWEITGAKASTTAGYATVLLTNNGPAQVPSLTAVGSSTVIWAFR